MRDTDHDELAHPINAAPPSSEDVRAVLARIADTYERMTSAIGAINERLNRMEADWGLAMNALVQVNLRMAQKEEAASLQSILDKRFPRHSEEDANAETPDNRGVQ